MAARNDRLLRKFDGLSRKLLVELSLATSEGSLPQGRAALDHFRRGVDLAAKRSVIRECRGSREDFRTIYDLPKKLPMPAGELEQRYSDFTARLDAGLVYAFAIPDMIEAQTGLTEVALKQREVLPLAALARIRRSFDYLSAGSIQNTLYSIGILHFKQKGVVPRLDRETTPLCRDRMAWQVQQWDQPFVDGRTGAGWLFPPFVGGLLPRAEGFHYCRSSIAPFG